MRISSSEDVAPREGEVGRLDEELYRLGRGAGRLRLRIGQALHRLGDGIHELGFSTLGAYALERSILSGELLKSVACEPGREPDQAEPAEEADDSFGTEKAEEVPTVQISGSPEGKVTLRMRVPADVLVHYRELERAHREKRLGTSFLQFLCVSFWRTWVPALGVSDRWEAIYRRDRYRCTSPVCHQRNVTLHHVEYRAHGGTDDPDNLTSACAFCHLQGEHGGRLKILPPGSNPTWLVGRQPILRVHRRERTLLA